MNIKSNALWLGASLALFGSMITPAIADEWNKETILEFNAPVEVPGKVLLPGKYVFKLADSQSDRNIVQIFSEDASGTEKLVTTILAIPDYRRETPDKTMITFEERRAGSPEAIHSWFYPGDNTGWEFVYSKAEHVAMNSNTTAPAAVSEPATALAHPQDPAPEPEPTLAPEPAATDAVEKEEALIAQNEEQAPPPAAQTESDTQGSVASQLPETGGYSALALMTSLVMLGGGALMVFVARPNAR